MEFLTHNQTATGVRREYIDGREFVVSQMTMIVPGVLRGSKGPLLYPADEVGKDPTPWNGMPITYKHPVRNGKNVSAKHPGVVAEQGIGVVKNAKAGGKLRAEAWVDVSKANKLDPRIIKNLDAGLPIEISTGLFTTNDPAPPGARHNGKPYSAIARRYRPDHLAVLVDERGACSVDDGCGLGVNSNPEGHNQYTRISTAQLKSHVVKAGGELASKHNVSAGGKIQTSVISKVGTGLTITKTSAHAGQNDKDEHEHKVSWHGTSGHKETAEKQKAHVASVRSGLEARGLITADGNHDYEFHVKGIRSTTSNSDVTTNDWAAWRAKHQGMNALGHVDAAHKSIEKYKKAVKSQNPLSAQRHLHEAESHSRSATEKSKAEAKAAKSTRKLADPTAKAKAMADKHNSTKASLKSSAQAKVSEAMQASKANAKAGNHDLASHFRKAAVEHASAYSQSRAKQHLATAKAYAKAGDHKTAAAYQAKADFHKQHIASLNGKRMVRNAEMFPTGERDFVINQLATNANPEGHNQYTGGKRRATADDWKSHKVITGDKLQVGHAVLHDDGIVKKVTKIDQASVPKHNIVTYSDGSRGGGRHEKEYKIVANKRPTSNSYGDYKCSGAECKMKGEIASAHSELAEKTGREVDHAKASRLHQDASQAYMSHEDGADVDRAAKHSKKAEEHKDQAGPGFMSYNEESDDDLSMNANPAGHNQYTSNNPGQGFHGVMSMKHGDERAHQMFATAAKKIATTHDVSPEVARNYLDSSHGRHVGGIMKSSKGISVQAAMQEHHGSDKKTVRALQDIHHQTREGVFNADDSLTEDGHGGPSTHSQEEGEHMAKLTANQRTATIKKLTSNSGCGCYNADDVEYLEGLSDNRLSELSEAANEHLATNSGEQPTQKTMTDQEWMDNAPPGIQAIVSNAAQIMENEKAELIGKLVANIKDETKRKARTEFFQAKTLPQVREFAEAAADLAPAPVENRRHNVYGPIGNTPIVTDNVGKDDDALEMTPQRFDWNTIANLPGNRKN